MSCLESPQSWLTCGLYVAAAAAAGSYIWQLYIYYKYTLVYVWTITLWCVAHMRHAINHLSRPKQKPLFREALVVVMAGTKKNQNTTNGWPDDDNNR